MASVPPRTITRFQDADDVQAPAAGATDTGKAWLWNNATAKFEPTDVVTAAEGTATYLPLAGGTLTGQLTMADGIRIDTDHVQARDASGLKLTEDGGVGILIADSSGAVLVNTSTALTGFLGSAQVQIQKDTDGALLIHRTTTDANGPTFEFLKRRSGFGVVSSGDRAGTIQFSAADSVDAAPVASIYAEVDGTPGSNDMPGRLVFATTADGANAVSEAMRISNAGHLILADGKRIETDEVRARDTGGLALNENAGAGVLIANSTGQLLVNTTTTITGALAAAQLQVNKTSPGNALFVVDNTSAGNGPTIELLRRRTAFGVLSSGDRLGTIAFSGADSIDAAQGASIYAEVDGTPGSNDMPGRIVFATSPDGFATPVEAMRINASQNIIIADSKRIETDEIRARDSGGLKLYEDSGLGILVADGGNVGIGGTPDRLFMLQGSSGGGGVSMALFDSATPTGSSEGPNTVFGFNGGTAKYNLAGDLLARFMFQGQANDFTYNGAEFRSNVIAGGNAVRNDHTADLSFWTKTTGGASATRRLTIEPDGSFGFNGQSYGSGVKVIFVANAATNPSTNPSGGGILYADAGAGKWRGSGGTTTTFGAASPHCSKCGYDFWEVVCENEDWGAKLMHCGWCGHTIREGPESVLDRLTPEQLGELV